MKTLLAHSRDVLKPLGYQKQGARFFKINDGVFQQVHFQAGAHGTYFFVNACMHPIGLPSLLSGKLVIPGRPGEHDCILRRRIEDIVVDEHTAGFRTGLVSRDDELAVEQLLLSLPVVETWFGEWGSFERMLAATDAELKPMLTVVPLLRAKAGAMLRCFSALRLQRVREARFHLDRYLAAPAASYSFSEVDAHLATLVTNAWI